MKQSVSLLAALMLLLAIPKSLKAYDFSYTYQGQTLYYNIVNGNAQVSYQNNSNPRYSNLSDTLVIPSSVTYNGTAYSVTSIGNFAFSDCSGLTSVTIPNSVTSIGDGAFYYCSGLSSVTIPNSITSIGNQAFVYCSGLTSVNYIGTIAQWCGIAFSSLGSNPTEYSHSLSINGSPLTNLVIPEGVTQIKQYAFEGCSGLTSLTIPSSVTSIGNFAFDYCSGLSSVTIPNSVTSIGGYAFYHCSGLTSVTIGNSVTSIGGYAFSYCNSLTSVTIPNSITSIGNGAFSYCSGLSSVTIGNSVTYIGSDAFYNCSGLTSVNYTGTIAQWCGITFSGVSSNPTLYSLSLSINGSPLTNLVIPEGVTQIKQYAFYNCSGLTSVTIPNSVTSIGDGAFSNCSGLTSVTIPNSVTSIGDGAFYNCSGLTSVTIPNSVTSIGDGAFYYCSGLSSVTIPNSVTSIGNEAFRDCSNLAEITSLAQTAPTLGSYVFWGVLSTVSVHIPCGSTSSYQLGWSYFSNFIEPSVPNIDIQTANSTMGTATVTTQASCHDSTAVITATANYGYHFTQWNDGNTNNPRTFTLTQDTAFTAFFDRNEYQLTLNNANPTLGTVSGSGTYLYLDTAHIVANAIDHHHLVHWSDGDRNSTRNIVINADIQLTATFSIDTHTVTIVSSDIDRGMVEASGTEFVYGTPCTVTATAYTGYTFAGWSNGITANPYTFTVISDMELTALFTAPGEETYTVTVVSANTTMGSVSGGGQALSGDTMIISAIPNEGYRFVRWNDGDTENPRVVTVTEDITYTAYFESTTQGVTTIEAKEITIYSTEGRIVARGAEGMEMRVFDVTGREVVHPTRSGETPMLPKGVYLVKIGTLPARKVVVIR